MSSTGTTTFFPSKMKRACGTTLCSMGSSRGEPLSKHLLLSSHTAASVDFQMALSSLHVMLSLKSKLLLRGTSCHMLDSMPHVSWMHCMQWHLMGDVFVLWFLSLSHIASCQWCIQVADSTKRLTGASQLSSNACNLFLLLTMGGVINLLHRVRSVCKS